MDYGWVKIVPITKVDPLDRHHLTIMVMILKSILSFVSVIQSIS